MIDADIVIRDYEASCAAGIGFSAIRQSIARQTSGLKHNDLPHSQLPTQIGKIDQLDQYPWPSALLNWRSRNNALIHLALQQGTLLSSFQRLREQFGSHRVGLVMGSSTSSIDRAETAYRSLTEQGELAPEFCQELVLNPHAPALFVSHLLDIEGPCITINTACSSSAKVFATAARWLKLGLVDAVLVGGADSLGLSVLHGFHSLQLISANLCKPFDADRDGINLGEAAGFALLTRADRNLEHQGVTLTGFGESSDAHHMSHPHPEGLGPKLAIGQALAMAKLKPKQIDYINLHGTASRANDFIEGNLIGSLFPTSTYASSTKAWTGHTLGAAGILEALIAVDSMYTTLLPGTLNLKAPDPAINIQLSETNQHVQANHVMSNSFGFGGNNACLIFSRRFED